MARKPLDIPWKELMPDRDGPAPMVEVVSSGGAEVAGADGAGGRGGGGHLALSGDPCSGAFTDHQLAEKVERVRRHIASGFTSKLPDKGAKLRASLRALEEEQQRRRSLPRAAKDKDDEECREIKKLKIRSSPDSLENISSNGTTSVSASFASRFSKLFEGKAAGADRDVYSEEFSIIHKDHFNNLNELHRKRNNQSTSRVTPFQGPKSVFKDKQQCFNGHYKGVALSSGSSLQQGKKWVNNFPKKRKFLETHGPLKLESRKDQDVVLLDEDVQAVQQVQEGDDPDERLLSSTNEAKIYYPSRDHPECVELCQSDIKCLEPESYMSSTIMNFYIQYLQKSISSSARATGEHHFCNTYFYSKLEEAISHKGEIDKHLTKLRRWWKGVNIFNKAYIFLPIHRDLHWSLVIICIPAKEDEYGPIILHLDSLRIHASNMIFENIERYLKGEWTYLNDTAPPPDLPFSERIWRNLPRRIDKKTITVPQQKNEYDCGLFVLYFMERFIEVAPARLKREDLAMFGSKWFHPEEASGLRKRLKELLVKEFARLGNHESHVSSPED